MMEWVPCAECIYVNENCAEARRADGCYLGEREDECMLPAVAPLRSQAHWEEYWDDNYLSWSHKCSNCGNFPLTKDETMHDEVLSNFCPYCGADMRGERR